MQGVEHSIQLLKQRPTVLTAEGGAINFQLPH